SLYSWKVCNEPRRPQDPVERNPTNRSLCSTVSVQDNAAGKLLGSCKLNRQRRFRSSDQGDAFAEQDGVDLDLDLVDLVKKLGSEVAAATEPDVLTRLTLEVRDEASRVSVDPLDRGRGRQRLVRDHVLGEVWIGAVEEARVQRGLMCTAPHDHGVEPASLPRHAERFPNVDWAGFRVASEQLLQRVWGLGEG